MQVQILSRKLIPPSSPTPPHLQKLKVSSFDQLVFSLYGTSILFYPATPNEENYHEIRSKQLQKSLSEILTVYYPLAGRYIDDEYLIDCNDKGAEYLESRVSVSFSEFIRRAELESNLRNLLLPYTFQLANSPLLCVQFNKFECGGLAIGICVTHRIADAFTMYTFINSWVNACRIGIDKVHPPSFDLGSICPPRAIATSSTVAKPSDEEKKIVMRSFVFDNAAISKLKLIANSKANDPMFLKHQPTRVELVMSLVWKALISVSRARQGQLRPSVLVIPQNMRGKTNILSKNCCGNLVRLAVGQEFVTNDVDEVQLHDLVGYVRNTTRRASSECAKASNAEELFMVTTNAVKEMNDAANKSEVDVFVFNNMYGFPMYENDFGWGKPSWVTIAFFPMELIFFAEAKGRNGIEAWVSLEESLMLLFQKNPEIIALTSHSMSRL